MFRINQLHIHMAATFRFRSTLEEPLNMKIRWMTRNTITTFVERDMYFYSIYENVLIFFNYLNIKLFFTITYNATEKFGWVQPIFSLIKYFKSLFLKVDRIIRFSFVLRSHVYFLNFEIREKSRDNDIVRTNNTKNFYTFGKGVALVLLLTTTYPSVGSWVKTHTKSFSNNNLFFVLFVIIAVLKPLQPKRSIPPMAISLFLK